MLSRRWRWRSLAMVAVAMIIGGARTWPLSALQAALQDNLQMWPLRGLLATLEQHVMRDLSRMTTAAWLTAIAQIPRVLESCALIFILAISWMACMHAAQELHARIWVTFTFHGPELQGLLASFVTDHGMLFTTSSLTAGKRVKESTAQRRIALPDVLAEAGALQRQLSEEGRFGDDEEIRQPAATVLPTPVSLDVDHFPLRATFEPDVLYRVDLTLPAPHPHVSFWVTRSKSAAFEFKETSNRRNRRNGRAATQDKIRSSVRLIMRRSKASALPAILHEARRKVAADHYNKTRLYRCKKRSLRDLAEQRKPNNPQVILKKWLAQPHTAPVPKASWDHKPEHVNRLDASSFIFPEGPEGGALQALLGEAMDFFRSESWYITRGIPYRKGFLLHGSPRCGKTHFARLLAGQLGAAIYVLELGVGSGITDDNLPDLLENMAPRSILLLKNIDSFVHQRALQNVSRDLSYSGLLNVLDGLMGNKSGALILLTTSNLDKMLEDRASSSALLRPGRVDRRAFFGKPFPQQIKAYFLWLFDGCGSDEEINAAAENFLRAWPKEETGRSRLGFAELKGYLSRYLTSGTPMDASSPEELLEFQCETAMTQCVEVTKEVELVVPALEVLVADKTRLAAGRSGALTDAEALLKRLDGCLENALALQVPQLSGIEAQFFAPKKSTSEALDHAVGMVQVVSGRIRDLITDISSSKAL